MVREFTKNVNDQSPKYEERTQDAPLSSVWCGRQDLNLQGCPPDSKSGASASSATPAWPFQCTTFCRKRQPFTKKRRPKSRLFHRSAVTARTAFAAQRILAVIVFRIAADGNAAVTGESGAAFRAAAAALRTRTRTARRRTLFAAAIFVFISAAAGSAVLRISATAAAVTAAAEQQ